MEHVDIICIYDAPDFSAQINYTFNLVLSPYNISYKIMPINQYNATQYNLDGKLVISYGKKYLVSGANKQIHIYASDLFDIDYRKTTSLPKTPLKKYDDIPVLYFGQGDFNTWIRKSYGLIETNIDIIASSFFMISRYEEVISPRIDKYGGFPASATLAFKEGFLDRPIINEYMELLRGWIISHGLQFERKQLWHGKDFAICLTHDIDEIDKFRVYPPLGTISRLLSAGKAATAWAVLVEYLRVKASLADDPYRIAATRMIKLEADCGFTSSFYLMPEEKHYQLGNKYLQNTISKLKTTGFEIGIHPDYKSCQNTDSLTAQKHKLEVMTGNIICGQRVHFLRCKIPDTWNVCEEAGFIYDTSLGFNDRDGFRCGICYPFHPFDLLANRELNIWELPLTVMDITLDIQRKMSIAEASNTLYSLLNHVQKYGGVFVLLLHPSYFSELITPDWFNCYHDFYNTIFVRNVMVSSASTIIREWADNFSHSLVESH